MMRNFDLLRFGRAVAMAALLGLSPATAEAASGNGDGAPACEVGSYALADHTLLDIGPGEPGQLRWRLTDGRTGALKAQGDGWWKSTSGWTDRPDGHDLHIPDCGRGPIQFGGIEGRRLPLIQTDTQFKSGGVVLTGRLTMPAGKARVPIVVLVHGAEHTSALERYSLQRQFASVGIGVFAYDKRGTGVSGGHYTQNYLTLVIDVIHATREARRLAGARAGWIGYQAGSQGGWVAPLAARIEPVDFVIVSFGLAVSPLDEDREAIAADIARAGFGPEVEAKAMEIADATATLIESNFTDGYAQLAAVKAKYGDEPWFGAVRGNITWYLLANTPETIREQGPKLLAGVPAHYDPMPVLANLQVPQLWILGGQDRDAPPGETLRRLAKLQEAGQPITTAVFPDAEHGMYEFETRPDGERVSTRQPDGYFRMMSDYIKGHPLGDAYGNARISSRRPES